MNPIFPIDSNDSSKQNLYILQEKNADSSIHACEFDIYKGDSGNFMYSTLITRLMRLIVLILMMIGVWLGKSYGTVGYFSFFHFHNV